ncbi:hypothetical protein [Ruminococcus callidus]|uniref:hypothetical protein n=1 Tax=Ruminococcus callidus TaxID=40519 RepID=UPI0023F26DF4|nr:hypothetical protein [Ruminococcus callidus]
MPYADHTYYTQSYLGRRIKEEETFLMYAERASEYIDMVTFDRLSGGVPEELAEKVQKCCCAIAEALADYADYSGSTPTGSGKASETIGKYSVSYTAAAQTISGLLYGTSAGLQDYLRSICIRYLGGTRLMYRGCGDVCQ